MLTINGEGSITATSSSGGAGIGSGAYNNVATPENAVDLILIKDSAVINATGGGNAANIGYGGTLANPSGDFVGTGKFCYIDVFALLLSSKDNEIYFGAVFDNGEGAEYEKIPFVNHKGFDWNNSTKTLSLTDYIFEDTFIIEGNITVNLTGSSSFGVFDGSGNITFTGHGRLEDNAAVIANNPCVSPLVNHPKVDETCTSGGTEQYWECTECGKYFSDAAGEHEIADLDSLIIPTLEHSYGAWTVATAPTATTAGEITRVCVNDSSHTETQALPMLNTTDYTYTVVTAATDKTAGTGRYTLINTTYGALAFDVVIPAVGSGGGNNGLSGGAIAGIVIGSVVLVGAGGFAIFWFAVKKRTFAQLGAAIKSICSKIGSFFKGLFKKD